MSAHREGVAASGTDRLLGWGGCGAEGGLQFRVREGRERACVPCVQWPQPSSLSPTALLPLLQWEGGWEPRLLCPATPVLLRLWLKVRRWKPLFTKLPCCPRERPDTLGTGPLAPTPDSTTPTPLQPQDRPPSAPSHGDLGDSHCRPPWVTRTHALGPHSSPRLPIRPLHPTFVLILSRGPSSRARHPPLQRIDKSKLATSLPRAGKARAAQALARAPSISPSNSPHPCSRVAEGYGPGAASVLSIPPGPLHPSAPGFPARVTCTCVGLVCAHACVLSLRGKLRGCSLQPILSLKVVSEPPCALV